MKTNVRNFKKLILVYESITLKQIEEEIDRQGHLNGYNVAEAITGYSNTRKCILCKPKEPEDSIPACKYCIHRKFYNKIVRGQDVIIYYGAHGEEDELDRADILLMGYKCMYLDPSYYKIANAETALGLLRAFRTRAKYLRSILSKLNYKQP